MPKFFGLLKLFFLIAYVTFCTIAASELVSIKFGLDIFSPYPVLTAISTGCIGIYLVLQDLRIYFLKRKGVDVD